MPLINEASPSNALFDALAAGIDDISQQRLVTFVSYIKRVLPLDGFVFWIRAEQIEATGSLHYMSERQQEEDETAARNAVVFTTTNQLAQLNTRGTTTLMVGSFEGMSYAFSSHGWFNALAGVWHYTGSALTPAMETQLVDEASQIDPTKLIVSNSLPAWLSLVSYTPPWLVPLNPLITLYPSFLVPDNLSPPYGSVHIEPSRTESLQGSPTFVVSSHYQLTTDQVRVTLYGCDNAMALDFLDLVLRFSFDQDIIGIMNMPVVRDDKRAWPEGMILAQKKLIDFQVSYNQSRVNDLAVQLITAASMTVLFPPPDC